MNSPAREIAERAKRASRILTAIPTDQRSAAIRAAVEAIEQSRGQLLEANQKDLITATALLAGGKITRSTFERLQLTANKIDEMTQSMLAVAKLADPVGCVL